MRRSDIHFPTKHAALRDDVHELGALVGDILREQGGDGLFELVEHDRVAAIARRDGEEKSALALASEVRGRPPALARDLVRAFLTWFQVVNLAEQVHRIRRRRQYFLKDAQRPQPGGVEDAIATLKGRGYGLEDVLRLLRQIRIEPVFTAHPTESTRQTILRKQQTIATHLLDRLDPTLTPNDMRRSWSSIRIELTSGWQTEDHPREQLTVADERENVLFYLVDVLYRTVPAFYEEIALALEKIYGVAAEDIELPTVLHFGSWVGGDLDANPDVHARSIRETLARQQQVIINAYFKDCQTLSQRLSQSATRTNSQELSRRIDEYAVLLPGARAGTPARHDRMPYRVLLAQISERLRHTHDGHPKGYQSVKQFRADIQLIGASLKANKGAHAGLFYVRRLLRRIDTFGFHLAALDVRQHASVLHQVVAGGLDVPDWIERPRNDRRQLLHAALEKDTGPRVELDALGKRNLGVFEAIMQVKHRYGAGAIGYFIISGAEGADDVLAALLLARWAEAYDKRTGEVALDLAPEFASLDALERCGETLRELLADPLYRRHLEAHARTQCVLVGYSESNEEGGFCAGRFAAHQAQRALARTSAAADEKLVVFHARGGSIARGGGRIDALVRAAPAGAVNGTLRLTEQGERVQQSYGLRPIAMRTLERAFNSLALTTSSAQSGLLAADVPEYLACGATLAAASRDAYRRLVLEQDSFGDYFRAVTPIDVIARMQIGSRPIQRGGADIAHLLPTPWVFAWTQARHMLPGWYGAGAGLAAAVAAQGLARLREIYAAWPFLRQLVDDVEAMLARADLDVAEAYHALAPQPLWRFIEPIRAEYALAAEQVKAVKNVQALLDNDPTLQRSIRLRNPYIDPMNLMQVDLLQRWRASGRRDVDLFHGLIASISGIAQGLQSTG